MTARRHNLQGLKGVFFVLKCQTPENITSAESVVRDADMAKTMMEYAKSNLLAQGSQSMLAQANQTPQAVINLLQ